MVLPYLILIHLTALAGLILFPLPGWRIFLSAVALSWIGWHRHHRLLPSLAGPSRVAAPSMAEGDTHVLCDRQWFREPA